MVSISAASTSVFKKHLFAAGDLIGVAMRRPGDPTSLPRRKTGKPWLRLAFQQPVKQCNAAPSISLGWKYFEADLI